jgi:hypothetical protein
MPIDVQIDASDLGRVITQIRMEGRKDLSRQMGDAIGRAVKPIQAAITASAAETMPSGYSGTLTRSLAWRRSTQASGQVARLLLRTYGDGRAERRDVPRLEKGELRHPLYGQRKKTWYVTKIRPGFHKRGTDGAADAVVAELDKVVADFAQRLIS